MAYDELENERYKEAIDAGAEGEKKGERRDLGRFLGLDTARTTN